MNPDHRRYWFKVMKFLRPVSVCLLLPALCVAQSWRPFQAVEGDSRLNGARGSLFLFGAIKSASPTAKARWVFDANPAVVVADLPFESVGGITKVSDARFLVTGWTPTSSSGQGSLCLIDISLDGATVTVSQASTLSDVDPINVCWHPALSLLVVQDLRTKSLIAAPYSGGVSLPALSSFSLMIGQSGCPLLDDDEFRIYPNGLGFGVGVHRRPLRGSLTLVGGAWSYQETPEQPEIAGWGVHNALLQSHAANLTVEGYGAGFSVPASFDLRFLTGGSVVVAQGQQTSPSLPVSLPPPPEFFDYPGGAFQVQGSQIRSGPIFRPLVRYGAPMQAGSTMRIGRGLVDSKAVYVGSAEFQVDCPLNVPSLGPIGSGSPFAYNAYLAIAFGLRGPGAPPDPVLTVGGNTYLTPALSLELLGQTQQFDLGGAAARLAVPSESGLEGLIVLFQWYIQSAAAPQEVAVSDVFATRIWAAAQANMAAQGGTSPGSGGSASGQAASTGGSGLAAGAAMGWAQQARERFRPTIEQRNAPGASARFHAVRQLRAQ